jgi:hypothetical protein
VNPRHLGQVLMLAGLLALVGGGLYLIVHLRGNLVESCVRVNELRREVNLRGVILRDFLNDAADAREQATVDVRLNREKAANWRRWADEITAVEIPNCDGVVDLL